MLQEYALVPDIFDVTCYGAADVCDLCLRHLKEPLLTEALVRDLRLGEWSNFVANTVPQIHPRAKEILKKLITHRRLRSAGPVRPAPPADYREWCDEALASHGRDPLAGIIATNGVASQHAGQPLVADILKLTSTPWWKARSPSLRLGRTTPEYLRHLRLILEHANSLMFIDPHLNPTDSKYRQFGMILQAVRRTTPQPRIEIHRVSYRGSGASRQTIPPAEIEAAFRRTLGPIVAAGAVPFEVLVWDEFHDRHLITDIVGVSLLNGFDTTTRPGAMTTWGRLGRVDRDDIQREFDPAAERRRVVHRFRVPCSCSGS